MEPDFPASEVEASSASLVGVLYSMKAANFLIVFWLLVVVEVVSDSAENGSEENEVEENVANQGTCAKLDQKPVCMS